MDLFIDIKEIKTFLGKLESNLCSIHDKIVSLIEIQSCS